ncbi:hypothetical protein EI94DRAFT_1739140 [Lactarius quietus]|nr:hypothetical protein EI94DRAFT_1739140 [Lactarius quietus]
MKDRWLRKHLATTLLVVGQWMIGRSLCMVNIAHTQQLRLPFHPRLGLRILFIQVIRKPPFLGSILGASLRASRSRDQGETFAACPFP